MTGSSYWWQVFMQSQDASDYGGVALWDGYPLSSTLSGLRLDYGDLITVTAHAGNDHYGKYNLTDNHSATGVNLFSITKTGHTDDVAAANIDRSA